MLLKAENAQAVAIPLVPLEASAPQSADGNLESITISEELATLFHSGKTLLDSVLTDPEVPANQRAQVLNSVSGIIEKITKLRTDLYNAERIRNIEHTLLRVMTDQPPEVKEAFMAEYDKAFKNDAPT